MGKHFVSEGYLTQEQRYILLKGQILSKLDRELTDKETRYINWLSGMDMETCKVFGKLFQDIKKG